MIHKDDSVLKELIKNRREEAIEVKDCYTKFAFQVLILSAAFLGFIAKFDLDETTSCIPYIVICSSCMAVIFVLICVSQIGCHKYSTANRHSGFELHINRTYDYGKDEKDEDGLEFKIRHVGWEEAMCAWRVVQPIIFEEIYKKRTWLERRLFPFLKRERKFKKEKYHWWDSEYLVNYKEGENSGVAGKEKVPYHPGSYLENTQNLIHILCGIIYLILSIFYIKGFNCIHRFLLSSSMHESMHAFVLSYRGMVVDKIFIGVYWLVGVVFSLYCMKRICEHRAMRRILESGFLSIQSCAVVWRLVVIAHLEAVEEGFKQEKEYKGYTCRLAEKARIIRKHENLFNIHAKILKNQWPDENKQSSKTASASKQTIPAAIPIGGLPPAAKNTDSHKKEKSEQSKHTE